MTDEQHPVCESCRGRGLVRFFNLPMDYIDTCPDCNGTGVDNSRQPEVTEKRNQR